jgi:hypothetical protein
MKQGVQNMKMNGRLFKGPTVLKDITCSIEDGGKSYQDRLELLFIRVCKELGTAVPMWVTKNTKEYVTFRRTSFNQDQFMDPVLFDRMEIRVEEDHPS